MIILCPDCWMPVTLTKNGLIPRHGWRGYRSNARELGLHTYGPRRRETRGWVKTRQQCTGTGKNSNK